MSIPINTRGLLGHLNMPQSAPSTAGTRQAPQPPGPSAPTSPLAPGQITRDPNQLRQWDTARPLLRFDFRTPEEQATFHRAFAQVRTEKDKVGFMKRFFNSYDGQVQIPRRVVMDTSNDEAMAREVQERMGVVMETGRDEEVAREVQGGLAPMVDTARDDDIAIRLQERTRMPRMERDEEIARRLQARDEARRRNAALNDEAIARRLQQQMDRENTARGYGTQRNAYTGNVDYMADQFGGMSFDSQRGPSAYERRRPGRGSREGGNGYNQGGNRGYGHPGHCYNDEEYDDFEQSFGGGMGGYGPGYGRGGGGY